MKEPHRSKTRVVVAVTLAVLLTASLASIYWISRPPARRQVVVPVDPNEGWEAAYQRATSNLGTMEQTTQARQAFVDKYPRSPGTPDVLNQLGGMYMQQNDFAASLRAYEAAKRLVAEGVGLDPKTPFTPSPGILDVNIAHTHREAGDFAKAEAILTEVIARPLPATVETATYVPQVFVAPLTLADVRQDQNRPADADALRRATADRALELAAAHPAAADWMASYAASAYMKRINALLESKPPKF